MGDREPSDSATLLLDYHNWGRQHGRGAARPRPARARRRGWRCIWQPRAGARIWRRRRLPTAATLCASWHGRSGAIRCAIARHPERRPCLWRDACCGVGRHGPARPRVCIASLPRRFLCGVQLLRPRSATLKLCMCRRDQRRNPSSWWWCVERCRLRRSVCLSSSAEQLAGRVVTAVPSAPRRDSL